MISVVCIIPTSSNKHSIRNLKLLINSLQYSAKKIVKLKFEFVTSNTKCIHQFTTILIKLGVNKKLFYINVCKKSAGFSEMNNLIFEKYKTESPNYFLLVNDDVWVNQSFFKSFLSIVKQKQVGIISPLIVDASILSSQKKMVIDSYGVEYFKSGYAKNSTNFENQTQLATAACLFLSKQVVSSMQKSYGFIFNDLLYYYLEDVEFSIRAKMLDFKIVKSSELITYHFGSSTSGKKSYFTMYHTYRNILWLIILTWPREFFIRNSINILIVQLWVLFYSIKSFGFGMYIQIILDTVSNFSVLKNMRKKTIDNYSKEVKFSSLFSQLIFRTYHGIKIKGV